MVKKKKKNVIVKLYEFDFVLKKRNYKAKFDKNRREYLVLKKSNLRKVEI
jgi:hypothetical protein